MMPVHHEDTYDTMRRAETQHETGRDKGQGIQGAPDFYFYF